MIHYATARMTDVSWQLRQGEPLFKKFLLRLVYKFLFDDSAPSARQSGVLAALKTWP